MRLYPEACADDMPVADLCRRAGISLAAYLA
jgi:hypothetical protein